MCRLHVSLTSRRGTQVKFLVGSERKRYIVMKTTPGRLPSVCKPDMDLSASSMTETLELPESPRQASWTVTPVTGGPFARPPTPYTGFRILSVKLPACAFEASSVFAQCPILGPCLHPCLQLACLALQFYTLAAQAPPKACKNMQNNSHWNPANQNQKNVIAQTCQRKNEGSGN